MEGIINIRDTGRRARRKVTESGDEAVSGFSRVWGTNQRCWDTPASLSGPELRKQTSRIWKLSRDLPFRNILAGEQLRSQPSFSEGRSRSTGVGVQKRLHLALKARRSPEETYGTPETVLSQHTQETEQPGPGW